MQNTSSTWKGLFAAGAALQARATIGGTVYTDISAPVIHRATMQDRLAVGNVVSASLSLSLRGAVNLPRSAAVIVEVRLNDGETASEWLPQGTFYISRRMRDPVTGLLALECYDALLKANALWTPSAGAWPRTLAAVTAELAALLGVTLDSRTVIPTGAAYAMSEPDEGTTIRDALSLVAQAAGGNWIITPAGKLRLVRLGEAGDTVDVAGVVGGIDVGQAGTITGVRSTVDGVATLTGDDTGLVVDVALAPVIAADMSEALIGQAWQPFRLDGAVYDPAAELGDAVRAGANGEVASALCSEQAAYSPAFRGSIAAPDPGEVTDEYPYLGSAERTLALAKAAANRAVERYDDNLTQQEIFNRLTDNGAAQGLVMYNGQLYMNATYMRSGTIDGDYVNAKKFIVVDENNNVIASFDSRITLGKSADTNVELDYNSFEIKNQSGSVFLKLGDARDEQGVATVQDTYVGDGNNTNFLLRATPTTINSVKVDDVTVSNWSLSNVIVMMTTAPAKGAVVVITYVTEQPVYNYTLGTRDPNDGIGIWSVAEGYYVGANGFASHAEGQATNAPGYISHAEGHYSTAYGYASHAEGYDTKASGNRSHAEGWETEASGADSHTEGNSTEASGECGHAEGGDTVASGDYSHAEGRGTIASATAQHVVGNYNVSDNLQLEIVGNGTNDSNRSNARTLDQSGNEWIAGALSVGDAATTRANLEITPANIAFIGMNPTGGTSNDTREWWANKGTCYAFIAGANQVNGQPAEYGFIVNIVYASEVYQMWLSTPGGARYHRGGNSSTSVMPGWTADDTITSVNGQTGAVSITPANIGAVASVSLYQHDANRDAVWTEITKIPVAYVAPIFITGDGCSILTRTKLNKYLYGIIARTNATNVTIVAGTTNAIYTWSIYGLDTDNYTVGAITKYTGTVI